MLFVDSYGVVKDRLRRLLLSKFGIRLYVVLVCHVMCAIVVLYRQSMLFPMIKLQKLNLHFIQFTNYKPRLKYHTDLQKFTQKLTR